MANYAPDHAGALADLREAGTAVTFTKKVAGTHNEAEGTFVGPTRSEVAGYAIRKNADPELYASLSLRPEVTITLLFAPNTYGEEPALDSVCRWVDGKDYTVKMTDPVAPDGNVIITTVVMSR